MRFIFIILLCFSLGNLNYYLFFQDDSSIKGTIKDLTFRNSEKVDKSIYRIKDNTSKLDQKAFLQSESQKKEKDKVLVTQSKSEKKQDSILDEKNNRKKLIEEKFFDRFFLVENLDFLPEIDFSGTRQKLIYF